MVIDDSNRFNIWLAMSREFQTELVGLVLNGELAVEFPGLNNLSTVTLEFFSNTYDSDGINRIFRQYASGNGKTYRMWSVYVNAPDDAAQVRSDLDSMESFYASDFMILGGWHFLSDMPNPAPGVEPRARPMGMDWEGDPSSPVGSAFWATPSTVLNFMPLVMVDPGDEDTPPTYEEPTVPVDGNLLYGQSPRYFVLG